MIWYIYVAVRILSKYHVNKLSSVFTFCYCGQYERSSTWIELAHCGVKHISSPSTSCEVAQCCFATARTRICKVKMYTRNSLSNTGHVKTSSILIIWYLDYESLLLSIRRMRQTDHTQAWWHLLTTLLQITISIIQLQQVLAVEHSDVVNALLTRAGHRWPLVSQKTIACNAKLPEAEAFLRTAMHTESKRVVMQDSDPSRTLNITKGMLMYTDHSFRDMPVRIGLYESFNPFSWCWTKMYQNRRRWGKWIVKMSRWFTLRKVA